MLYANCCCCEAKGPTAGATTPGAGQAGKARAQRWRWRPHAAGAPMAAGRGRRVRASAQAERRNGGTRKVVPYPARATPARLCTHSVLEASAAHQGKPEREGAALLDASLQLRVMLYRRGRLRLSSLPSQGVKCQLRVLAPARMEGWCQALAVSVGAAAPMRLMVL